MTRKADLIAARSADFFRNFINLRAKYSNNYILIHEGARCSFAYQSWFHKVNTNHANSSAHMHVNGKRDALKLHGLISKSKTHSNNNVLYFLDSDYNKLIDSERHPNIYLTDGYAIENEVLSANVVLRFIKQYFGLSGLHDHANSQKFRSDFDSVFEKYLRVARPVHFFVYFCAQKNTTCYLRDVRLCRDVLCIDFPNNDVRLKEGMVDGPFDVFKVSDEDRHAFIEESRSFEPDFALLDPTRDWRGKFHLEFLVAFLGYLVEQRSERRDSPSGWGCGTRPPVDLRFDTVLSVLAHYVEVPKSLKSFLIANGW